MDFDLKTSLLGQEYDLPIGIAPVGMAGTIWPGAERLCAQAAVRSNIPSCQSTVAAASPEDTAPHIGENGWFQHYPVRTREIRRDMLKRIRDAGFKTLVVTVDVPGESRRERQRRALLSMPPKITPSILLSMLLHPKWSLAMAVEGPPRMKFPESYTEASGKDAFVHAGRVIRGYPEWGYLEELRSEWSGNLIVKGVLCSKNAQKLVEVGADALWVSNHAGRQFEAGPAAIEQLPKVRAALPAEFPLIFDSGVETGLDVMKAIALGANFVFLGKAFMFAVAAFGAKGLDHLGAYIARGYRGKHGPNRGASHGRDRPAIVG